MSTTKVVGNSWTVNGQESVEGSDGSEKLTRRDGSRWWDV